MQISSKNIDELTSRRRKKKGGGGRLARSETVTVRLDPKLRYLAELAARKQRRTLSSYIEWALEESLGRVVLREGGDIDDRVVKVSVSDAAEGLWDVDEADRFVILAFNYPDLLTHQEQILWKLVHRNGYLWKDEYIVGSNNRLYKTKSPSSFNFERLRDHWDDFVAVAKGEADADILPKGTLPQPKDNTTPEVDKPD
jgi:hypothetical protein